MMNIFRASSNLTPTIRHSSPRSNNRANIVSISMHHSAILHTGYSTEMIEEPKLNIADLVQIISYDPALTASVLKVANSAYMGLGEPVENISSAVMFLGIEQITRIALNVGCFDVFASKERGLSPDLLKNIWLHSTAVALMSWRIAAAGKFDFEKDVYVAGLLHDLGKLFFATSYTAVYASIRARVAAGETAGLEAEADVFGLTHVEASQCLGQHWKLPGKIMEVATKHHDPTRANPEMRPMVLCIAVANVVAHQLIQDEPADQRLPDVQAWMNELISQKTCPENFSMEKLAPLLAQEAERARQFMTATSAKR